MTGRGSGRGRNRGRRGPSRAMLKREWEELVLEVLLCALRRGSRNMFLGKRSEKKRLQFRRLLNLAFQNCPGLRDRLLDHCLMRRRDVVRCEENLALNVRSTFLNLVRNNREPYRTIYALLAADEGRIDLDLARLYLNIYLALRNGTRGAGDGAAAALQAGDERPAQAHTA